MASVVASVQVLVKDLPQFERLLIAIGMVVEAKRAQNSLQLSNALDELERAAKDLARQ